MPIFLPSLWLFAIYISDIGAALLGRAWIAGRILYLIGYSEAAAQARPRLWHPGQRRHHSLGRRARHMIVWRLAHA